MLAAVGVLDYRETIAKVVAPAGCTRVLEIGCADGSTTRLLHATLGQCCLVPGAWLASGRGWGARPFCENEPVQSNL